MAASLRIVTRNVADAPAGMAPELERGDYVVIAVIDTGSGMPREVLERAFEPFFTTKGVGKGSGLGLAQVFGLARQFGGTARLQSAVGRGHHGGDLPAPRPLDRDRRYGRRGRCGGPARQRPGAGGG